MLMPHPIDFARATVLTDIWHRRVALNIARLVAALEAPGLRVEVTRDLATAAEAFQACTPAPLAVLADPRHQKPDDLGTTTIAVILRDSQGQPVGSTIQRLRRAPDGIQAAMHDLSFWSDAPDRLPAGLRCITQESWLAAARGTIVYSCGYAVARAAQAQPGISVALVRLAHALALVRWEWHWLVGRGRPALTSRYAFERYGVDHIGNGCWLLAGATPLAATVRDHPHLVMGAQRAPFLAQAARVAYGDVTASLAVPAQCDAATSTDT